VGRLRSVIQFQGKGRASGEKAVPLPIVIEKTSELPMGEVELEQRKRGVGARAMLDKTMDSRFVGASTCGKANARFRNELSQQLWRNGSRTTHVFLQLVEPVIPRRLQRHRAGSIQKMALSHNGHIDIKKRDGGRPTGIGIS